MVSQEAPQQRRKREDEGWSWQVCFEALSSLSSAAAPYATELPGESGIRAAKARRNEPATESKKQQRALDAQAAGDEGPQRRA